MSSLDPDQGGGPHPMLCLKRQLMGENMTGSEQMFLMMVIAAFALFGAALAYADVTTASLRDQPKG